MKLIKKTYQDQSGQMLIIVVLILVVGITIALSLASRSVTDIRLATNTEQSSRAYTAAEAGVEEALKKIADLGVAAVQADPYSSSVGSNNVSYTISTSGNGEFEPPERTKQDEVVQVDLQDYTGTSVTIHWYQTGGTSPDTVDAAIIASLVYTTDGTNYQVEKWAYDPPPGHAGVSGFETTVNSSSETSRTGGDFQYSVTLTLPAHTTSSPTLLRIRPLWADNSFKFTGDVDLPAQGYEIESTGTSGSSERKVKVFKSKPALPSIFDYVLFSGGDLSK